MNTDIPMIDFPQEWIVKTGISKDLLQLYTNYPVRLKCEMLILCMGGEIEASVNVSHFVVKKNDIVILTPGSIIQIHRVEEELELYALGFSQQYVDHQNLTHLMPEILYKSLGKSRLSLKPEGALMLKNYYVFLLSLYDFMPDKMKKEIAPNMYQDAHTCISMLYKDKESNLPAASKSEQICRHFAQLVFRHYKETRKVSWYAEQMSITHAYLCTTVKQVTGNTCGDIISYMVTMDAKSQLKLTHLSIQMISDSLNFPNVSFFCKYFKRYAGVSPLEYRNKD